MAETALEVDVTDAPPIPGLSFRHYRGEEDLPAIVEVINAENLADGVDGIETVGQLGVQLPNLPNSDPFRDVLIAEIGGRMVGLSYTWWAIRAGEYTHEHAGAVLPGVRGQGIGRAMLRFTERHIRELAAGHPEDVPSWYSAWVADESTGTVRLLLDEGYRPVRHFFEMTRDLRSEIADVPLPAGLEIRPVREEDHRRIFAADAEAFRDHWGHREQGEEDFVRLFRDPNLDTRLWRVAWDGDEVAGSVMNVIYAVENEVLGVRRGWLDRVSVRRPWRRRGLARALIAASLAALKERGMTQAVLGVDAENPTGALGLYEGLGFVVARRSAAYRKEIDRMPGG